MVGLKEYSSIINGTELNDTIIGTERDDLIISGSGYDLLDGGNGSDTYLVGSDDYNERYLDGFQDSGISGTDTIEAAQEETQIGLLSGFGANSGIEVIEGIANSTIEGEACDQVWDFSTVEIRNISAINAGGGRDNVTGSFGNDVIYGGTGHDTLNGNDGSDRLSGDDGHDVINGGNGNDELLGGNGNDILNGGNGDDTLFSDVGYDMLDGGEGSDSYIVTRDSNGFVDVYNDSGLQGFDVIEAIDSETDIGIKSGFDQTSGIEMIFANDLSDVNITGTAGNEIWDFSATEIVGITAIDAGAGNDVIIGSQGDDNIIGGAGQDILTGGNGADTYSFNSQSGHDIIRENGDNSTDIIKFEDVDSITDLQFTQIGNDLLITTGPTSSILIEGQFTEGTASQSIEGLVFADGSYETLREQPDGGGAQPGDGEDSISGDENDNVLNGDDTDNTIFGNGGDDTLIGNGGYDYLIGGSGNDILDGGDLGDDLEGGSGNDTLTGGQGDDYFIFIDNFGHDTITDFEDGVDLIHLSALEEGTPFDQVIIIQSGNDSLVQLGDNSITLLDTDAATITFDDFILFG